MGLEVDGALGCVLSCLRLRLIVAAVALVLAMSPYVQNRV